MHFGGSKKAEKKGLGLYRVQMLYFIHYYYYD